ncbi:MAG: ArsC family (seleno)protein [Gemmataceae bacterium]
MSCKRAQGFLEQNALGARETVDASKQRKGRADALALARSVAHVVIARGKNLVRFDLAKDRPSDDILASHLLGPTGNLRAPAIRKGKTLYVGFSEEAYRELTA